MATGGGQWIENRLQQPRGGGNLGNIKRYDRNAAVVARGTGHSQQQHNNAVNAQPPNNQATTATTATTTTTINWQRLLVRFNFIMAVFHSCLAIVTLSLANLNLEIPLFFSDVSVLVLINGTYVTPPPNFTVSSDTPFRLDPYYRRGGTTNITLLTASVFLIAAFFHILNATILRTFYIRNLQLCFTPTRWIEYSISAPIMFFLISYSVGVRDRATLVSVSALVGLTMFFGLWVEVQSRPSAAAFTRDIWGSTRMQRLYPFILGCIPQTIAWVIVIVQFYGYSWGSINPPGFVYAILWGELILFTSFAAVLVGVQLSPPSKFYKGEIAYQSLSLVSKGVLGLILIVNVLMLSDFDELYNK